MSLKNDYLLYRAGRDQFGDYNDGGAHYTPRLNRNEVAAYHRAIAEFFSKYWQRWEKFCYGKTPREVWAMMFPYGEPALSTFDKIRRAFVSNEEFLKYALVLYRCQSLMAMGSTLPAAKKALSKYPIISRLCIEPKIGLRKPGRSAGYVAKLY